jgi:hypothetical protein
MPRRSRPRPGGCFYPSVGDRGAASGRAGDWCGASEGFQSAGIGKASRVVTDLGEDASAGSFAEAGKGIEMPSAPTLPASGVLTFIVPDSNHAVLQLI